MKNVIVGCLLLALIVQGCQQNTAYQQSVAEPEYLQRALKKLTDIIVYDIFSPPVASRIYAYPSIAAYEVGRLAQPDKPSLAGQLTELTEIPVPDQAKTIDFHIASFQAFVVVGRALIFSEARMDEFIQEVHQEYRDAGTPRKVLAHSIEYGELVAAHILEWADGDLYKQTRTYPKFEIRGESSRWQPTPPDYMEAIEPHWRKIRPFVIKGPDQFVPDPPTPFDMAEGSEFRKEVIQVYETVNNLDEEQTEIASFWDCNPYVSHHKGHVMFATKKITPGGHWMGIAQIVARQDSADFIRTAQTFALTSIALADAFISCWDEKYRSNLIRPETVINQHIDDEWVPPLQTPPFPEYTSGHSVISSAAAVMLTHLYGDNFAYNDDVEVEYGLPMRSFESFYDASSEAAISRLYGGIHYMPAIANGVEQGRAVGEYLVAQLDI